MTPPATFEHADGLVTVALATSPGPPESATRSPSSTPACRRSRAARRGTTASSGRRPPTGGRGSASPARATAVTTGGRARTIPRTSPTRGCRSPSPCLRISSASPTAERISEEKNADGTTTSRWEVTYPINNYLVTVNIAPYVPIEETYKGVDGDLDEKIIFWALPEHEEKARVMWKKAPKMLEVLGKRFGEYPFLRDKYWVAEAPYLGMEHQTLVAYGADFQDNKFGFDSLLLHETAHEWWGNKITAADWGDFWIHESFGTYAEAVYVNDTLGIEKYLEYMRRPRKHLGNRKPIVQGHDLTAGAAYIGDIYGKGSLVLHTPCATWRATRPSSASSSASRPTSATPTSWSRPPTSRPWSPRNSVIPSPGSVKRYLYTAALPRLRIDRVAGDNGRETVTLRWDDPSFEMPLPVVVGDQTRRLEMPGGSGQVEVATGTEVEVDPQGWVLAEAPKS